MDELGYEQMARSFARTGHFALLGQRGLAYSPLYPIVLSPIYALTSSMHTAYEWAKVENAVLVSLSVFPVYAIARSVLPRGRSLAVAGLSLLAPLMLYSGFEMSESLAYPLCLVAFWTMLRAVRRPSVGERRAPPRRDRARHRRAPAARGAGAGGADGHPARRSRAAGPRSVASACGGRSPRTGCCSASAAPRSSSRSRGRRRTAGTCRSPAATRTSGPPMRARGAWSRSSSSTWPGSTSPSA